MRDVNELSEKRIDIVQFISQNIEMTFQERNHIIGYTKVIDGKNIDDGI